jgi:2-C-methyl-D-erythritol 2,4-cyclodiphosphate synthase
MTPDIRVGHGWDVHAFGNDRPLRLGGVDVPGARGLAGHSDADVLAHAVASALLGSLALGDLGTHFPDTDPRFRDARSLDLLRQVAGMVRQRGDRVGNCDCTVIAESPRLAPHIEAMRQGLAGALGVEVEQVSVKATTAEKMGALGRGEGIAAHAVVLVVRES